jgi:hypothetical protein
MNKYKGRTIDASKPVRVHRNLHKDCFSVVQDGLVVAHTRQLCLKDARPYVNQRGRQKVLETQRKSVHAWIEGYVDNAPPPLSSLTVRYDPYKYNKFCVGPVGQEKALLQASHVWLFHPTVLVRDN